MAKNILILLILIVLSMFGRAGAAGADFFLDLIPVNPAPGASITVKIGSYSFDVNRSAITWQIDGKIVASGTGERLIQFTNPDFGEEKNITVSVVTLDGASSKKSFVLVGNDVDLLWKAFTSIPSAYKGKALSVIESTVRIAAVPHIFKNKKELAAKDLIYEWFLNHKKDINSSGTGKNFFTFQMKDYDDQTVILKISSKDNNISFEKSINFSADAAEPKILFYEENPLEGPQYNKVLSGDVKLDTREISVRAEPFFFSQSGLRRLSYEWFMNGEKIPDASSNILALRAEEKSGRTIIELKIRNLLNVLQFAGNSLGVNY